MIEILTSGPLLTVQDLGRPAARRFGVPQGGAMDSFALAAANVLLGNPPTAAGLELTAGGASLRITQATRLALTGADLGASLDGRPLPLWTALRVNAGQIVHLTGRRTAWGARAYLALAGGIDISPVLGSRATELASAFGGLDGRPLRPGDHLPLGIAAPATLPPAGSFWPLAQRPAYTATPTLRIVPGPHTACLASADLAQFHTATWRVSPTSNRMGYRLVGPHLTYARPCNLPSLGVVPGVVQLPPDGLPILLMADAQTTGGYPVLGTLISADLPLAAQLLPGDSLRFCPVSLDQALVLRQVQATALAYRPIPAEGDLLAALAGAPG